jgi:hypothetical protein
MARRRLGWALGALFASGCFFQVSSLLLPGEGDGGDLGAGAATDLSSPPDPGGDLDGPTDLAGASYDLVQPSGKLEGNRGDVPDDDEIDLTREGDADWAHWGLATSSDVNRKQGGNSLITLSSTGNVLRWAAYGRTVRWNDGTPTQQNDGTQAGLYIQGLQNGFTFTVPAGTTERKLDLYLSHFRGTATLNAHLSDGSAVDYGDSRTTGNNSYHRYRLVFRAASANQTLTVTWKLTQDNGAGSVDLLAATLD